MKERRKKYGQQTIKKKIFVLVPSPNNDNRNLADKYLCRSGFIKPK